MAILFCYDGSDSAKRALAIANATLGDRPLTLLHTWEEPSTVVADAFGAKDVAPGLSIAELERLASERAREVAGEGESLARELGFAVQARVERVRSETWQTILDVAEETDAEMILIGTHGDTAVRSTLLGSVSSGVIHHSHRPVFVVPNGAPVGRG